MLSFPKHCAVCGGDWSINHECLPRNDGRDKHKERELSPAQAEALENALSQELARTPQRRALWAGEDNAALSILAERERQKKRWGDAHDDEHGSEELARQAASFLQSGQHPLPSSWSHKSKVIDRDPRRDQLVKGAALALAAIQAHDRAVAQSPRQVEHSSQARDQLSVNARRAGAEMARPDGQETAPSSPPAVPLPREPL